MLVGAAADLRRKRGGMGGLFRGHRSGDTGELEPVAAEIPDDVPFAIPSDPIDPEEARYAPAPAAPVRLAQAPARGDGRRRPGLDRAGRGLVVEPDQYYVGEDGGNVVIFRGLNADLPGIELSSPYETTNVEVDRLSDFDADKVREGIDAGNLDDARDTVESLAERQEPVATSDSGTDTDTAEG